MNRVITFCARAVSLTAALAITATVLIFPRLIALDMHTVPHGWLVLLMFGMSFCYVHGLGFIPENRYLKTIFSPIVAWPTAAFASCMVFC
ncbi:MAG: cyd operon YbgE family protein [Burkholderiaceae bacterium]|nr:cyd operon YbgE family protein [Burkholderiaceae bacterium]